MKKEMQKWLYGVSVFAACVVMTGCGHEHTWTEATCTAPKTCSECGTTEGEPLTPSFVEHGVAVKDAVVGASYDYVTRCYEDDSLETIGQLFVTDYQIADTYEGYEPLEGYEWRVLEGTLCFSDENAWYYGMGYNSLSADYYENDFEEQMGSSSDEVYTINYLGEEYTECMSLHNQEFCGWNYAEQTAEYIFEFAFRVPKGYDGKIAAYVNYKNRDMHTLAEKLDEDSIVIRLK